MRKSAAKARSVRTDPVAAPKPPTDDRGLARGDVLKVERRYVVDGVVTCVTDKGRFGGVESVGSMEHIVLEVQDGTRMIPLTSVSEIEVVERAVRIEAPPAPRDDPAYH